MVLFSLALAALPTPEERDWIAEDDDGLREEPDPVAKKESVRCALRFFDGSAFCIHGWDVYSNSFQ